MKNRCYFSCLLLKKGNEKSLYRFVKFHFLNKPSKAKSKIAALTPTALNNKGQSLLLLS